MTTCVEPLTLPPPRTYSRTEFTALRARVKGLSIETITRLYFDADAAEPVNVAQLLRTMGDSPAWQAFEREHQSWLNQLRPHRKNLGGWLFEQDGEMLKNLFSFCVAATLDSVTTADKPHGVNLLADALDVDYRSYWQVSAASYLNHVPKARVVDVVSEAVSPEAGASLEKLKKAEAVATAERLLQGSGWLPEVLRNRMQPSADAALMTLDDDEEEEADDERASDETA